MRGSHVLNGDFASVSENLRRFSDDTTLNVDRAVSREGAENDAIIALAMIALCHGVRIRELAEASGLSHRTAPALGARLVGDSPVVSVPAPQVRRGAVVQRSENRTGATGRRRGVQFRYLVSPGCDMCQSSRGQLSRSICVADCAGVPDTSGWPG